MSNQDEGSNDPADALFERAAFLRELEQADAQARAEDAAAEDDADVVVTTRTLPDGRRILNYTDYLQDQRYYDDLKHVDYHFIDYVSAVIEQDKSLGKGGLCWDAAFILAEYLTDHGNEIVRGQRMIELGCGTGVCGILLAKGLADKKVDVTLTDLPELQPLLQRNIDRNFRRLDDDALTDYVTTNKRSLLNSVSEARNNVTAAVLDWSNNDHELGTFDVLIASDVVATLYDPVALAHCIHRLCHEKSTVYISFKERLSEIHRQFEAEMEKLFGSIQIVCNRCDDATFLSRNRNPKVYVGVWMYVSPETLELCHNEKE